MTIADRVRETLTRWVLGAERAALVETLGTVDTAALVLALDDLGWVQLGGPRADNNTDFTAVDRVSMVRRSRAYYYRDPLARQAVRLYTAYALGQGIEVRHKDPAAQAILDKFRADPGNAAEIGPVGLYEQSDRLCVDGELFLAVTTANVLRPQVRHLDPLEVTEFITNPDDYADIWYFRRTTPRGPGEPALQRYYANLSATWSGLDEDAALGILRRTNPGLADDIRAHRQPGVVVIHSRINTIGSRGYPLLTAMLDWTKATRLFMEDRATITRASAQFAFKKKVKSGPAGVNALAQAQRTNSAAAGGAANPGYNLRGPIPGATHVSNDGVEIEQFRFDTGAGNAREDARLLKLHAVMAVGMSEHYFGDATNGNLATATAMERPQELALGAYQLVLKTLLHAIYAHVLDRAACSAGGLEVLTPPLLNRDQPKVLQALTLLATNLPVFNSPPIWKEILTTIGVEDVDAALQSLTELAGLQRAAPTPLPPHPPLTALSHSLQGDPPL